MYHMHKTIAIVHVILNELTRVGYIVGKRVGWSVLFDVLVDLLLHPQPQPPKSRSSIGLPDALTLSPRIGTTIWHMATTKKQTTRRKLFIFEVWSWRNSNCNGKMRGAEATLKY